MPLFVGAFMEMLDQVRVGKRLDAHCRTLRRWLAAEPLDMVPKSRRARAELNLRVAEWLALAGSGRSVEPSVMEELTMGIEEAQMKLEDDAAARLQRDREALRNEPATKLDVAQLVVDMLALGRTWTEYFNEWSAGQKADFERQIAEQNEEIGRLRDEITRLRQAIERQSGAQSPGCRPADVPGG